MPSEPPDIPLYHKGGFFQCGGQVEIIFFYIFFTIPGKKVCDLILTKPCQRHIKIRTLQTFNLNAEQLLIPSGIQSHAVVRKDIGFLLRLRQIIHKHTWNLCDAFLLRRCDPAMPRDDIEITVDDDRVDEAELPQG